MTVSPTARNGSGVLEFREIQFALRLLDSQIPAQALRVFVQQFGDQRKIPIQEFIDILFGGHAHTGAQRRAEPEPSSPGRQPRRQSSSPPGSAQKRSPRSAQKRGGGGGSPAAGRKSPVAGRRPAAESPQDGPAAAAAVGALPGDTSAHLFAQIEELADECASKDAEIEDLRAELADRTELPPRHAVRPSSALADHAEQPQHASPRAAAAGGGGGGGGGGDEQGTTRAESVAKAVKSLVGQTMASCLVAEKNAEHAAAALEARVVGLQQTVLSRLPAAMQKLADLAESAKQEAESARQDRRAEMDAETQQLLTDATEAVDAAEAELAAHKQTADMEMGQLRLLNTELNKEADRLREALDAALQERASDVDVRKDQVVTLQREMAALQTKLARKGKKRVTESSALQTALAAKEKALEEQDVTMRSLKQVTQEARAQLAAAEESAEGARAQLAEQRTGKVQHALLEARRKLEICTASEAKLELLLEARQKSLSAALERCSDQERVVTAAQDALHHGPSLRTHCQNENGPRDSWLGAGRSLKVGERCEIDGDKDGEHPGRARSGMVAFFGPTVLGDGSWVGVRLDEPGGKHDGRVRGQRYFECAPRHGLMVRPNKVKRAPDSAGGGGGGHWPTSPLKHRQPNCRMKLPQRQKAGLDGDSLVRDIRSLLSSAKNAELEARRAQEDARAAQKREKTAERELRDVRDELRAVQDGKERAETAAVGHRRDVDKCLRDVKGLQQDQEEKRSALEQEKRELSEQLSRAVAKAGRTESRQVLALTARSEQMKADGEALQAANHELHTRVAELASAEGEARRTAAHAATLQAENGELRRSVGELRAAEAAMQMGGGMSAPVRTRLEHEAAVARLQCEQVSAQLAESQAQLKQAEKDAHSAKQNNLRGEQSSHISAPPSGRSTSPRRWVPGTSPRSRTMVDRTVLSGNMTAVGTTAIGLERSLSPKALLGDGLEPRMQALRRQRQALLAETAELRRTFA